MFWDREGEWDLGGAGKDLNIFEEAIDLGGQHLKKAASAEGRERGREEERNRGQRQMRDGRGQRGRQRGKPSWAGGTMKPAAGLPRKP